MLIAIATLARTTRAALYCALLGGLLAATTHAQAIAPAAEVRLDALGDPLPEGALMRLGTGRFRPPSTVMEIALAPDEKTIVTLGEDLMAWDTTTGQVLWQEKSRPLGFQLGAAYGSHALAFTPDGKHFYAPAAPGEVTVWETATGKHTKLPVPWSKKLKTAADNGPVRSVDDSPDG